MIITSANSVIATLYCDSTIKNGRADTTLANAAPAPRATKRAGSAQQMRVDDDANSDKKFADFSFIVGPFTS